MNSIQETNPLVYTLSMDIKNSIKELFVKVELSQRQLISKIERYTKVKDNYCKMLQENTLPPDLRNLGGIYEQYPEFIDKELIIEWKAEDTDMSMKAQKYKLQQRIQRYTYAINLLQEQVLDTPTKWCVYLQQFLSVSTNNSIKGATDQYILLLVQEREIASTYKDALNNYNKSKGNTSNNAMDTDVTASSNTGNTTTKSNGIQPLTAQANDNATLQALVQSLQVTLNTMQKEIKTLKSSHNIKNGGGGGGKGQQTAQKENVDASEKWRSTKPLNTSTTHILSEQASKKRTGSPYPSKGVRETQDSTGQKGAPRRK